MVMKTTTVMMPTSPKLTVCHCSPPPPLYLPRRWSTGAARKQHASTTALASRVSAKKGLWAG
eukprot:3935366-Rhodomonas_salina.5